MSYVAVPPTIVATPVPLQDPCRLSHRRCNQQTQLDRRRRVADEVQLLHGAGHRDVQQAGAARRAVEDLVGVDDDDAVELQALHRLGR